MSRQYLPPFTLEPVVLGLRLEPFSLGHWLLLHEMDNPVLYGRVQDVKPFHLFMAALICTVPYAKSKGVLRKRWLPLYFRVWGWRTRNMMAAIEFAKFSNYILEGTAGPEVLRSISDGTSVAPAPCNLITFLCHELHQPLSEALECPVRMARWLHASWLDLHGRLQVWDETKDALWNAAHSEEKK